MRNDTYWKQRMENMIIASERSVLDYERMLTQAYERAMIEIQKEIDAFFQRYAKDNKVTYAEARRRLNAREIKDFNVLLNKWYELAKENGLSKEYQTYLKNLASKVYISRLESLQASIRTEIEKLKSNQFTWMTELMSTNYMAAYYTSYFVVAQGVGVSVNFASVDRTGVEKAIKTRWDKRNYSDSVWADRDKLAKVIGDVIPRSFAQGLSSNQLGDMIAREMGTSKNRGRTLARTEVNYLCNQANIDVYKACGIHRYEFLATLDMRTSEICRSLDGSIFPISQAVINVNYPPMHPNCRSTTIPYFEDDWTEERVAKDTDGKNIKVPRRMTQEEWIKQYAPENQKEKLLRFNTLYRVSEYL